MHENSMNERNDSCHLISDIQSNKLCLIAIRKTKINGKRVQKQNTKLQTKI